MALRPCKECGAKVSTRAKTCPSCGCPRGSGLASTVLAAMFAAFLIAGILIAIALFVRFDTGPSSNTDGASTTPSITPEQAIASFKVSLSELNAKISSANSGAELCCDPEYLGDGIVKVTALYVWINATNDASERYAQQVLALWKEAEGSGFPVFIRVVDPNGRLMITRPRLL